MSIQHLPCNFNHLSMPIHSGPCRSHLCSRTSGEEPRAHRVMQAEGGRSRGGRSVASDSGGRRDCRALERRREAPDGKARRHPPPGHYEPGAPIGRSRHPEGHPARGDTAEGPRRAVVERLEASRPMRPGRENRGDATGRPTQEFFSASPPRLFQGREPPRRSRPGWIPRARQSPDHPVLWRCPCPPPVFVKAVSPPTVMAGLGPAIHAFASSRARRPHMGSPARQSRGCPGQSPDQVRGRA
jgi:hypothetical protein